MKSLLGFASMWAMLGFDTFLLILVNLNHIGLELRSFITSILYRIKASWVEHSWGLEIYRLSGWTPTIFLRETLDCLGIIVDLPGLRRYGTCISCFSSLKEVEYISLQHQPKLMRLLERARLPSLYYIGFHVLVPNIWFHWSRLLRKRCRGQKFQVFMNVYVSS